MNNCEYYEELICASLDGELTPDEERALREHLETCEDCRAFLASMEAVSGAAARGLPEPPADLADRVMAAVRAESAKPKKKIVPFPRWARAGALAAAAALVIWAGFRVGTMRMGSSGAAAPMAAPAAAYETAQAESDEAMLFSAAGAADAKGADNGTNAPAAAAGPAESAVEAPAAMYDTTADAAMEEALCRGADLYASTLTLWRTGQEEPLLKNAEGALLAEALGNADTLADVQEGEADYVLVVTDPSGEETELPLWETGGRLAVLYGEAAYDLGDAAAFFELLGLQEK